MIEVLQKIAFKNPEFLSLCLVRNGNEIELELWLESVEGDEIPDPRNRCIIGSVPPGHDKIVFRDTVKGDALPHKNAILRLIPQFHDTIIAATVTLE